MKPYIFLTLIHTLDHNMFIHWVITYTKFPHITGLTLIHTLDHNMFIHWVITYTKFPQITDLTLIHTLDHNMLIHQGNYLHQGSSYNKPDLNTYT
jgi:hypothetical protein